jgi:hypothetical protein
VQRGKGGLASGLLLLPRLPSLTSYPSYGLLLCIGITKAELTFKHTNGSARLLALLRQHGVFPYTILQRGVGRAVMVGPDDARTSVHCCEGGRCVPVTQRAVVTRRAPCRSVK